MHDVNVTPFHAFMVLILPFWSYICILDHNVSKPGLEPRARASEIWSQARAHCKPLSGPGWAWAWTGSARRAQGLRPGPAHHYLPPVSGDTSKSLLDGSGRVAFWASHVVHSSCYSFLRWLNKWIRSWIRSVLSRGVSEPAPYIGWRDFSL
jgi:hypothetical protein